MKSRYWLLLLLLPLILTVVVTTCTMDTGLEPGPWIEGQIIIDSINRVEEGRTGDMVVVVAPDFPPQKWTDIIKTPPIYFDRNVRKDTTTFRLPLNYGTYDVVAVLWKPKGEEWSFETISNILGVYTAPNIFKPKEVTITRNDKFVSGINIYADFGFVRYGSFIKGKITYKGDFNPNTQMMILASFPMKPETVVDYLFALGWDLTLPVVASAYDPYEFKLSVAPGFHKFVALFWKGKKGNPYDFKKIADLMLPDDLPQIGPYVPEGKQLRLGETLEWFKNDQGDTVRIDLVADFSKTYP
jgi:hypothetical protein